jgi:hypothetical protein
MRIRTLLDASEGAPPRYLAEVVLLASTWAAWGRGVAGVSLEVVALGRVPAVVRDRLRDLDVPLLACERPRVPQPASANKLAALALPSDGPVLLVDNDVCFLQPVAPFAGRLVRAALADYDRVSPEEWRLVAERTGFEPLRRRWTPLADAALAGRRRHVDDLYLNSGVAWLREPAVFAGLWQERIDAILTAVEGDPEPPDSLVWSDQAAFATAIAATGGFDLLSTADNFRPSCFAGPLRCTPRILHPTQLRVTGLLPCSQAIRATWEHRVLAPLHALAEERGRRARIEAKVERALLVRDRLLGLAAELDLDGLGLGFPVDTPG